MKSALLVHLASTGTDLDTLLELANKDIRSRDPSQWQAKLISRMVETGDVRRAYSFWQRVTGLPAAKAGPIHDAGFQSLPGLPPFNWVMNSTSAGAAELDGRGGLAVEYYARLDSELASQLLVLRPGTWQLRMRVSGDVGPGEAGVLRWTVTCSRSKNELGVFPIGSTGSGGASVTGVFSVPGSGCEGQWLRLVGKSPELPTPVSVTITNLQLTNR
jgi:hypothetical protein